MSQSKTRAEYLETSLSRTRPWEAEGISRRTWYRRRGSDGTGAGTEEAGTSGTGPSPADGEKPVIPEHGTTTSRADRADIKPEGIYGPRPENISESAGGDFQDNWPENKETDAENRQSSPDSFASRAQNPPAIFETLSQNSEGNANLGSQEPKIVDPVRRWWEEPIPGWPERLEIRNILTGKVTVIDLRRRDDDPPV